MGFQQGGTGQQASSAVTPLQYCTDVWHVPYAGTMCNPRWSDMLCKHIIYAIFVVLGLFIQFVLDDRSV